MFEQQQQNRELTPAPINNRRTHQESSIPNALRPDYNPYQNVPSHHPSSSPDDSYYDPPGMVSSTPDLTRREPRRTHLRIPSVNFENNPPSEAPNTYLLDTLTPSGNVASQDTRSESVTAYNPYVNSNSPQPPPMVFDNRLHNPYTAYDPNENSESDSDNDMPFIPFPDEGDIYETNDFFHDDEVTLGGNEAYAYQAPTLNSPLQMPSYNNQEHTDDYPFTDHQDPSFHSMPQYNQPGLDQPQPQIIPYHPPEQPPFMQLPQQHPIPMSEPPPQQPGPLITKSIELFRGNLVLDCPVSSYIIDKWEQLLKQRPQKNQPEMLNMRYSAVTCGPEDFADKFTLRQQLYKSPRSAEIFICITLYNETEDLLAKTLSGIASNIRQFVKKKHDDWSEASWKKISVCIVADGRKKLSKRTEFLMQGLGIYQKGLARNMVDNKQVQAHLYEYTTPVGVKFKKNNTVEFVCGKVPIQYILCIKENNKGKINSHRWFFQGFCKSLRPNICVLLDAGTIPGKRSIMNLWNTFKKDENVGGACGEIRAGLGKGMTKLFNPLVAAQNFEYKMSNILDKPMESVFGFITVLPGAFSAYRYEALINFKLEPGKKFDHTPLPPPYNDENLHDTFAIDARDLEKQNNSRMVIEKDELIKDSPLGQYFSGELKDESTGIFSANMFLAEDRILCFELVTKKNGKWLLRYVKSAHATTDVPEHLSELVMQRRRWLNGSFFAAIYSISHFYYLWRSDHSVLRTVILLVEFFYQTISILFSWFAIGNFFLVFRILTSSLADPNLDFAPGNILSIVFLWVYAATIVATFVLAFGNRPKGTERFYILVVCFFAILMAYLFFASIYISVKSITYTLCVTGGNITPSFIFSNPLFRDLVVSLMSTYALFLVSSFMFLEPWHIITSSIQYLLISPSYINVLNVYAFCNIHDISWGTKGDDTVQKDLGVARVNKDKQLVDFDMPINMQLIQQHYQDALLKLQIPINQEKEDLTEEDKRKIGEEKRKDWYALFRSTVVLAWVFTNVALVAVVLNTTGINAVENTGGTSQNEQRSIIATQYYQLVKRVFGSNPSPLLSKFISLFSRQDPGNCGSLGEGGSVRTEIYLTVILWSVAGLAAFRFLGATVYLILRILGK